MENKEKNFMSAIIYVHNAADRIEDFLRMVIDCMESNFEKSEIICVNDSSDDDSAALIKKVSGAAKHTSVSILNMSYFHGLEVAMNAGVDLSIGDFVLEFDTTRRDYDKEEIMRVYRKSLEGFDIVSASPDKRQKFSSNLFYSVLEKFANLPYKIYTESFRVLSRRVINRMSSMSKSIPYRKALYANCGLKTCNLRYKTVENKPEEKDKVEKAYRRSLAIDTLILFTEVGYSFSVTMTMVMMLVAVFMAAYSFVIYLTRTPIEGWTTTILFMAFAFFGLFGILTIIIKYLQILVELVFKRKKYSFESIEKLTK